jgi:hypothetical protein
MAYPALQRLADSEYTAAEAVAKAVPVTEAGAAALRAHLAEDRNSLCWYLSA